MATFRLDSLGKTPSRLLSWLADGRRALAGRSATVRWSLIALIVGGLSLVGYLVASSIAPAERVYLASGRRYQYDDLIKITRALDSQRIEYHVDDRRLTVAARSIEAAGAAIAKLEVGPRSLGEIRDDGAKASIWESPRDRDEREQRERAKVSETLINQLPGVEGSFVTINRPKERGVLRPTTKPSAFVSLQTEGGRELPFSVIDSITSILAGNEAGLTTQAITVMDRNGHKYLDAGNPALNALSSNRAREEELGRQILEKLDWITGVRVSVQLANPLVAVPDPKQTAIPVAKTVDPVSVPVKPAPGLVVGVNQAMSLEPDPTDELLDPAPTADVAVAPVSPEPDHKPAGRVWVSVPRSFYYNASFMPGRGEPSQDDLRALVVRTETQIRNAVRLVASEIETTEWEPPIVDVIPDEMPADRTPTVAAGNGSRRLVNDWAMAGATGAAAAALVALGTWVFGGRQPTHRAEPSRGTLRYHRGSSGTPPPTERVLEFVRRNPETAFSVLNRWTSQGGKRS